MKRKWPNDCPDCDCGECEDHGCDLGAHAARAEDDFYCCLNVNDYDYDANANDGRPFSCLNSFVAQSTTKILFSLEFVCESLKFCFWRIFFNILIFFFL